MKNVIKDIISKKKKIINVEDDLIDGGVTDNSNKNAPKEILSKNIIEFRTAFFVYANGDYDHAGWCYIDIKPNNEEYIFSISGLYSYKMPVNKSVLKGIQDIIDKHELVKRNGRARVTAGLPVEYQPWSLRVLYDSQELLYFKENGVPEADWTTAFHDYFYKLIVDSGYNNEMIEKA